MERTKILTALIAITMCASGLVGQNSQRLSCDELKQRHVRGVDLADVTVTNALTRILNVARAPGGVVTITACGVVATSSLTPIGPTLSDALDSIVIAQPTYRWYIDQGVVNLVPSDNGPQLLDVKVAEFEIKPSETVDALLEKLLMTPEVQHGIARFELTRQIGLGSLERPGVKRVKEDDRLTLRYQNLTVQEALNTIARTHGSAVWSYREQHCNSDDKFLIAFLAQ